MEAVADVTIAYTGEEALATVDDGYRPDVVLLDRHMPGQSGDEVLAALRDRDIDTRIIMITAIDPGLDILELPFDDYLCKPVERADLREAVDTQCQVLAYQLLGEYFEVEAKRAVIEAELPPGKLDDHEAFGELDRRADALADRTSRLLPEAEGLLQSFAGIDREGY
nr:response regulator [Halapricum sp. CBA1109]